MIWAKRKLRPARAVERKFVSRLRLPVKSYIESWNFGSPRFLSTSYWSWRLTGADGCGRFGFNLSRDAEKQWLKLCGFSTRADSEARLYRKTAPKGDCAQCFRNEIKSSLQTRDMPVDRCIQSLCQNFTRLPAHLYQRGCLALPSWVRGR
jgi:hypothetical protein